MVSFKLKLNDEAAGNNYFNNTFLSLNIYTVTQKSRYNGTVDHTINTAKHISVMIFKKKNEFSRHKKLII